jgi:hypothetical protein
VFASKVSAKPIGRYVKMLFRACCRDNHDQLGTERRRRVEVSQVEQLQVVQAGRDRDIIEKRFEERWRIRWKIRYFGGV